MDANDMRKYLLKWGCFSSEGCLQKFSLFFKFSYFLKVRTSCFQMLFSRVGTWNMQILKQLFKSYQSSFNTLQSLTPNPNAIATSEVFNKLHIKWLHRGSGTTKGSGHSFTDGNTEMTRIVNPYTYTIMQCHMKQDGISPKQKKQKTKLNKMQLQKVCTDLKAPFIV